MLAQEAEGAGLSFLSRSSHKNAARACMLSRSETELSLQPIWFGTKQGRRSTAGGFAV
jgi:hypothetical protein